MPCTPHLYEINRFFFALALPFILDFLYELSHESILIVKSEIFSITIRGSACSRVCKLFFHFLLQCWRWRSKSTNTFLQIGHVRWATLSCWSSSCLDRLLKIHLEQCSSPALLCTRYSCLSKEWKKEVRRAIEKYGWVDHQSINVEGYNALGVAWGQSGNLNVTKSVSRKS